MSGPITPETGVEGRPIATPIGRPVAASSESLSDQVQTADGRSVATKDVPLVVPGFIPTRGPGQAGLERLAAAVSDRDEEILGVLDAHRFLTSAHVQRLCFTSHASALAAARASRRVLHRLESLGVITGTRRRVGGLGAGSAAAVWMLTSTGKRLLSMRRGLGAIGRVREPGSRFVQHYLAIADTRLALQGAATDGRLQLTAVEIEPKAWRSYLGLSGERLYLKPDLYAATVTVSGGVLSEYEVLWFIEVDRGTESIPTLLKQCKQYETYRRTGTEQNQHGTFPLVLWIVPDNHRADRLTAGIAAARLQPEHYRVTTPKKLIEVITGAQS